MDAADRLVESTRTLLWQQGYVATSPKAIQAAARVGQGSMYHHFAGKADLAFAAISRTAAELRDAAEELFTAPGTAKSRLTAYLRRERDVLKGCPIGGLSQDPGVMADPKLRGVVEETLAWVRRRIAEVIEEGLRQGEFTRPLDPLSTAAALLAVLQGGYVLARAANNPEPFDRAVDGALALLDG